MNNSMYLPFFKKNNIDNTLQVTFINTVPNDYDFSTSFLSAMKINLILISI